MGILRIRNSEAKPIIFGRSFIEFIRNQISTKPLDVTYSNATGQSIVANQILYTYLNPSVDGYIEIKSLTNQVLNGSGVLNLSITHKTSNIQSNQNVNFNLYSSNINIDFNYNSIPESSTIYKNIDNRELYIFNAIDFIGSYSDYDNDTLYKMSIYGDVSGYLFNSIQYIEGDWVLLSDVDAGLLGYRSLNQDIAYLKNNTWKSMDSNGLISNSAILNIDVRGGGNLRDSIDDIEWEVHLFNSTLHPYLSNNIDGANIEKIRINSIDSNLFIQNNGVLVNVGDEILMSDMDAGRVNITYNYISPTGSVNYTTYGDATYIVNLNFNAIIV